MTNAQLPTATGRSRGGTGLPPTAVVLDIDGVIAPIGGPTVWGDDTMIGNDEDGVHLSPMMCAALDELHRPGQVGCCWLTDWNRAMRHHLDLLPGRAWPDIAEPGDGHSPAGDGAGDHWDFSRWWKRRALEAWLHRHPEIRYVVWVDDKLHPDHVSPSGGVIEPRPTWTGTGRLAGRTDVLLVAPHKRAGLTRDDLSTLTDWIDTHTATASDSSRQCAAESSWPPLIYGDHPSEELQRHIQDILRDAQARRSRTPPPSRP